MSNEINYVVMLCEDGCDERYIGSAKSLDGARALVERHERGEVDDTPRSLWATAKASGNPVPGCDYPEPHDDEPVEWAGESGSYAICRMVIAD